MRDAIWALKYYKHKYVSKWFGKIMYEHISNEYFEENLDASKQIVLIPIPLSKQRLRERGYNQSELIAQHIVDCDTDSLVYLEVSVLKKIETAHQAHTKNKRERMENIRQSFVVTNAQLIEGRDVKIIDDVITTGATTTEARKMLLEAGAASVSVLAVAH